MIEINIGILPPEKWLDFKTLEIEAVKINPTPFGRTLADVEKDTDQMWQDRLRNHSNGQWYYFAESEGKTIGLIGAEQSGVLGTEHVALITSMYAQRESAGVTKLLLGQLLAGLMNSGVIKAKMYVNAKLDQEIKLFQEFGFNIKGTYEKEYMLEGKYYDILVLEIMVKI